MGNGWKWTEIVWNGTICIHMSQSFFRHHEYSMTCGLGVGLLPFPGHAHMQ